MSGFIEGEDRHQATLFPERLDDYIAEDSPVRAVDVFVDDPDLSGLGFKTESEATGRPGYHPATLLKLFIYGYLNRAQSSRRLKREAPVAQAKSQRLEDKITALKKEMARLKKLEVRLLQAPDRQIALTDPDARCMATRGRGTGLVGYNVQAAVDARHHLIVAHEVTNVGHDRTQLSKTATLAKQAIGIDTLEAVADRGYFRGEELRACEEAQITTYIPKPQTSGNLAKGQFGKRDFFYKPDDGEYECPAGQRLIYRFTRQENGQAIHRYWSSACPRCAMKPQCTTGDYRWVSRWEHEAVIEVAERRLDKEPWRMSVRRATVEHPFGTLKSWMGTRTFSPGRCHASAPR